MSSSSKRGDRRIPKERRKRAAASCDHCKVKRNKCERPDVDGEGPCKACQESGIECTYTIPRKRRVSSDVPGKRKYEYVDANFYKAGEEPDDAVDNLSSSSPPNKRIKQATPTATATVPAQFPEDNTLPPIGPSTYSASYQAPSSAPQPQPQQPPPPPQTAPTTTTLGGITPGVTSTPDMNIEHLYHYLQGPQVDSSQYSIPLSTNHGANGNYSNSRQSVHPPTPPPPTDRSSQGSQGIPLFADKLRYIGLHGSFSFLVQVRQLFSESEGVEGHNVGPQTMGKEEKAQQQTQASIDDIPLLPERQFADSLVETFFETVHRDYPMFNRTTFQDVYDQLWQPGQTSVGSSWMVCIYMVLVLGVEDLEIAQQTKQQFQDRYVKLVKAMIVEVMSGTSLIDVQALMLYVLHLFLSGQRDASWNMLGTAVRIAVGIGLHRGDAGFKLQSLERELRKRVWWTIYCFERMECSSLGRPSCIDDFDCTVDYPRDGALDYPDYLPYGYVHAQINLAMILGTVCKRFYLLDALSSENLRMASDLYDRLLLWRDQLPHSLRHGSGLSKVQYRHMLLLHAHYSYCLCVLTRPYLVFIASTPSANMPHEDEPYIRNFSSLCATGALECKIYMHKLNEMQQLKPRTGLDIYFVYYSTLILATQGLYLAKQHKLNEFNSIKEHVIANDILFHQYPDKARTMERFSQVATQVSQILREVVGKRLLEPAPGGMQFNEQDLGGILAPESNIWLGV